MSESFIPYVRSVMRTKRETDWINYDLGGYDSESLDGSVVTTFSYTPTGELRVGK